MLSSIACCNLSSGVPAAWRVTPERIVWIHLSLANADPYVSIYTGRLLGLFTFHCSIVLARVPISVAIPWS